MAVKSTRKMDFETAMQELEQLVTQMEGGQLSLADSLSAYQRGAELLNVCKERLDNAQQQVQILEQGSLKPFLVQPAAGEVEN